ncbi:uncharacterized protein [Drosophila kikkawai]|uniref:Uncharacterized protein n=1 Tax=Drosophila kikkawai TaxID=30033 RepID=A0A6P4JE30_DROKI|nr:uncharacterized protein LOC108082390 [Drosophila kikkawai]KAH8301618.1 hypothetical protein KR059_006593 [Drosophila kikkawai]
MDYQENSVDPDTKDNPTGNHENRYKAEISKFYATIATVSRNIRKDDWTYLQRHPEIRAIIRVITMEAINAKASNIHQFVADLFSSENDKELIEKINRQLKAVNEEMREGIWTNADGAMNFPESSENSSENNSDCPTPKLNDNNQKDEFVKPVCPENFKPSCK